MKAAGTLKSTLNQEINTLVHCELPASKRYQNSGDDTGEISVTIQSFY